MFHISDVSLFCTFYHILFKLSYAKKPFKVLEVIYRKRMKLKYHFCIFDISSSHDNLLEDIQNFKYPGYSNGKCVDT